MNVQSMLYLLFFICVGYLSGSVLYIRVAEKIFHLKGLASESADHNPGAFNAFKNGGMKAGTLTVLGDIFKGALPVWLYMNLAPDLVSQLWMGLVLAAPVFGHIYPVFYRFKGGKGIAVSFGVLLGLIPDWTPVLILAFLFLFFSLVLRIHPDSIKTALVFCFLPVCSWIFRVRFGILVGELLIMADVLVRLYSENIEVSDVEIIPFWSKSA